METNDKKIRRCKYSHYHLNNTYSCVQAGWNDYQVVETDEQKCEACELFKSRYIEYPITVNKIVTEKIEYNKDTFNGEMGMLVAVRPCSENKTFVGIFLGNLPLNIMIHHNSETGVLTAETLNNPAIFVPDLRKIIFGCGSWWHRIENEEQLREITDEDINNTWYVKALKEMSKTE